jgi:hypothetical protein
MKMVVQEGKFVLALGGFVGFLLSFFGTMAGGGQATTAVRNGAIGALLGFFMCRGVMVVLLHCMQSVLEKKYRERLRQARVEAERLAEEEAEAAERETAAALGRVNENLQRTGEAPVTPASDGGEKADADETAAPGPRADGKPEAQAEKPQHAGTA